MVFTLPSNASQPLYLENTITDFQMELPELILSHGTDNSIALASFTYPHTWYNVHDLANPSWQHFSSAIMPPGTISWWPSGPAWRLAQAGWRWPELSLLVGWPDRETLLLGRGNTHHMAPSQSKRDMVESFFVHCNLPANGHVIGNVRNCLFRTVPVKGHFGEVMCYEPQWMDWLPVCWIELKHVHMVITDGHGQKVPFEGRTCSVKLLLRQRGSYLRIWKKADIIIIIIIIIIIMVASITPYTSSRHMAFSASSKGCSIRPSFYPRALGCRPVCT